MQLISLNIGIQLNYCFEFPITWSMHDFIMSSLPSLLNFQMATGIAIKSRSIITQTIVSFTLNSYENYTTLLNPIDLIF